MFPSTIVWEDERLIPGRALPLQMFPLMIKVWSGGPTAVEVSTRIPDPDPPEFGASKQPFASTIMSSQPAHTISMPGPYPEMWLPFTITRFVASSTMIPAVPSEESGVLIKGWFEIYESASKCKYIPRP